MSHNPALAALFASINVGEPVAARGWMLFPLCPMTPPALRLRAVLARARAAEPRRHAHRAGPLTALRYGRTDARLLISEEHPVYFNAIHA